MRRSLLFMMALTVLWIGVIVTLQVKAERAKVRINDIVEEMRRCGRVYLLSRRDEVLDAMGQPVKEEVVPSVTGGLADRLYFRYTAFKTDRPPYVDIDHRFRKVVAVECAFARNDLKALRKTQAAALEPEALPGAPARP